MHALTSLLAWGVVAEYSHHSKYIQILKKVDISAGGSCLENVAVALGAYGVVGTTGNE